MTTFRGCVKGYCQIQIVNGTYGAITTPFQQYVSVPITPSIQNIISDIRQINFQDGNGNIIPAWLESVSGTLWASASVSAVNYWLKLTSPATISAGATVTVYMCFNSINVMDGITTGCAPQLTSTYAQYDNGTNIFNNYWNFIGTTAPSGWTVSGASINNGISIPYPSYAYTTTNYGLSPTTIVDFYGNFPPATTTNNAAFGFVESGAGNAGVCVAWTINMSNSIGSTTAAMGQTAVTGDGWTFGVSGCVQATGYHIYSIYWPSTVSATFSYDYGPQTTYTTTIPTSQYPLGGINTQGSQTTPGPFYWLRIRNYPPNGVMPAAKMITIPISISNNQNTATPAPFQQFITINPVQLGSNNFSADLGNIRFYSDPALTQPLYAWVESGNSNTVSATNIWVKLPNGIPANSTITIYMALGSVGAEYDGVYMGEAPQLSPTYGQYDNGTNVFNNYWNFAGTSLPSGFILNGVSVIQNNGISLTDTGAMANWGRDALTYASQNFCGSNYVAESYTMIGTIGGDISPLVIMNSNSTTAYSTSYSMVDDGIDISGSGPSYLHDVQNPAGTVTRYGITMPSGYNYSNFNIYQIFVYGATVGVSVNYNPILNTEVNYNPPTQYLAISIWGNNQITQWLRTRAYPPNTVMPTITLLSPISQPIPTTQLPPMF